MAILDLKTIFFGTIPDPFMSLDLINMIIWRDWGVAVNIFCFHPFSEHPTEEGAAHDVVDGGVEAIELRCSFKHSSSYFWSYLVRTGMETTVACILLAYMVIRGVPILQHSEDIVCDVHGFYYECHGNPTNFYIYTLYCAAAITIIYILCNVYNFLWLLFPRFGKLSRVMSAYKYNML